MPGIEDLRKRLGELRKELHDLAEAADNTAKQTNAFEEIFNALGRLQAGGTHIKDFEAFTGILGRLGRNLNYMGQQGPAVDEIKQSLEELVPVLINLSKAEKVEASRELTGISGSILDNPQALQARAERLNQLRKQNESFMDIQRELEQFLGTPDQARADAVQAANRPGPVGVAHDAQQAEIDVIVQRKNAAREELQAKRDGMALDEEFLTKGREAAQLRELEREFFKAALDAEVRLLFGKEEQLKLEQAIAEATKGTADATKESADALEKIVGSAVTKEDATVSTKGAGIPTKGPLNIPFEDFGFEDFVSDSANAQKAADNFQQKIGDLGFKTAVVKDAFIDMGAGVGRINVAFTTTSGVVQKASITMDRHGNIIRDVVGRYRTFTGAIIRNVAKVAEWTIAIGLTYAPMRIINSLIENMIDLQTSLADSIVTVGREQADLNEIFTAAQEVANATASDLKGVIQGYALAFAATSDVAGEAERATATQGLLRDSMILSELAGIDQAQALDTLVGALRQTGREYSEAILLIDSFVAVSRNANVSMNTLASAFTIAGAAAEGAGISFTELTALAATLAEATKLSADETGNAIRGFISGFQTSKSEQVLARYGIAVRDASGNVRDFSAAMDELNRLIEKGVLDDDQIREITNAIGGGFRRGAQFAALLKQYPRFLDLVAVASNASGESIEALGIKLDTVDAAMQRLSNAFQALAQAMGQEGGVLDLGIELIELLTGITDVITGLTKALGPASTALIAFGIASAFATTSTGKQIGSLVGLGRGATGDSVVAQYLARAGEPAGGGVLSALSNRVLGGAGKAGIAGGLGTAAQVGLGVGVPAIIAGGAAAEGDFEKSGISIAGAIVGALIGSATVIGAPVGAAIGSFAASALVDTIRIEGGFQEFIVESVTAARTAQDVVESDDEPTQRQARITALENIIIDDLNLAESAAASVVSAFRLLDKDASKLSFDDARIAFILGKAQGTAGEAVQPFSDETIAAALELLALSFTAEAEEVEKRADTPFEVLKDELEDQAGIVGSAIADEFVAEALDAFGKGEIDITELISVRQRREGFRGRIQGVGAAANLAGMDLGIREIGETLAALTEEEVRFLVSVVGQVGDASREVQAGVEGQEVLDQALKEFSDAWVLFAKRVASFDTEGLRTSFRDLRDTDLTKEDIPDFAAREKALRASVQLALPGLELPIETLGFLLSDGIASFDGNQTIANLLLQDIKELNQDQLEGIFNIPEGFVAGLPFTGLVGFGGGGDGADGVDTDDILDQLTREGNTLLGQIAANTAPLVAAEGGFGKRLVELGERGPPEGTEGLKLTPEVIAQLTSHPPPGVAGVGLVPGTGRQGGGGAAGTRVEENILEQVIGSFDPLVNYINSLIGPQPSKSGKALEKGVEFDGEIISADDPRFADAQRLQQLQQLQGLLEIQNAALEAQSLGADGPQGFSIEGLIRGIGEGIGGLFESLFGPDVLGAASSPQVAGLEDIAPLFPDTIPVNVEFDVTFQNTTLLDGQLIADVLEQRQYLDFANATRSSGAVGYEVTA